MDNRNFVANLQKSIDDVRVFVDGSYFWYLGIPYSNVYAVPALLLSAVVGSVMAVARAKPSLLGRARRWVRAGHKLCASSR